MHICCMQTFIFFESGMHKWLRLWEWLVRCVSSITLTNDFQTSLWPKCLFVLWLAICLASSGHKLGCSQYHHTLQSHVQHCHFRTGQWHMKNFIFLPEYFDWNSRDVTHHAIKGTGRPLQCHYFGMSFLDSKYCHPHPD